MHDVIIIGAGPGGYAAAARAAQLGLKTVVVEKGNVGGICVNYGCIPTKALLRSARVLSDAKRSAMFGISLEGEARPNFSEVIARSRSVASTMSKGVEFMLQKSGVELVKGVATLESAQKISVALEGGEKKLLEGKNILVATGARVRELPILPVDGEKIISYKHALTLDRLPQSMAVVGSGAIGSEMAYFYATMGTKVTLLESMEQVSPASDMEVSRQLDRSLRKAGIDVRTSVSIQHIDISNEESSMKFQSKKGEEELKIEVILSAVGVQANVENLGLEDIGVELVQGKIKVDEFFQTNIKGVCAIGDVIATPALAHVASAEGTLCMEKIAGLDVKPLDYTAIPTCIYTTPEVASVGITERVAAEKGYDILIGKCSFMASGKANAGGERDGFIKLIYDKKSMQLLGGHCVGDHVTEILGELTLAINTKATAHDILHTIHAHPTMYEGIMEATA
ncbi:MAG: dihydrolipoyl dehydrogenase, partial [Prevotellaceae bacterium]|nr:dihydrolipoyl dehydrogenase [Prevotellaceae bacterium]